jgi:hypothetical protein
MLQWMSTSLQKVCMLGEFDHATKLQVEVLKLQEAKAALRLIKSVEDVNRGVQSMVQEKQGAESQRKKTEREKEEQQQQRETMAAERAENDAAVLVQEEERRVRLDAEVKGIQQAVAALKVVPEALRQCWCDAYEVTKELQAARQDQLGALAGKKFEEAEKFSAVIAEKGDDVTGKQQELGTLATQLDSRSRVMDATRALIQKTTKRLEDLAAAEMYGAAAAVTVHHAALTAAEEELLALPSSVTVLSNSRHTIEAAAKARAEEEAKEGAAAAEELVSLEQRASAAKAEGFDAEGGLRSQLEAMAGIDSNIVLYTVLAHCTHTLHTHYSVAGRVGGSLGRPPAEAAARVETA